MSDRRQGPHAQRRAQRAAGSSTSPPESSRIWPCRARRLPGHDRLSLRGRVPCGWVCANPYAVRDRRSVVRQVASFGSDKDLARILEVPSGKGPQMRPFCSPARREMTTRRGLWSTVGRPSRSEADRGERFTYLQTLLLVAERLRVARRRRRVSGRSSPRRPRPGVSERLDGCQIVA